MGAAITARQTLQKKILQTFLKIPKTTLHIYLTYNPFQNVRHMLQPSKVWGPSSTTVHTFLKRQVLLSMRWGQTPKYCFLFFSNFLLWFHLYMSSCSGRLHYSWQLKHYLGTHNHRAVHLTYSLYVRLILIFFWQFFVSNFPHNVYVFAITHGFRSCWTYMSRRRVDTAKLGLSDTWAEDA